MWFSLAENRRDAEAGAARTSLELRMPEGELVVSRQMARFIEAAERGVTSAQFALGVIYLARQAGPSSDAEAARWFRRAARRAHTGALFNLGIMYAGGRGVPRDSVQAHMWFALGAARGDAQAARAQGTMAARLTSSEITEAGRLARGKADSRHEPSRRRWTEAGHGLRLSRFRGC